MAKLPQLLFVDDDIAFCKLIQTQMDGSLYAADFVNNAAAALKALSETDYNIVILDIIMPGTSGLELAKSIRKYYPLIPIIFLTAQNEFRYKAEGFEAGADDYISKPFNFNELVYRVRALLRRTMPNPKVQIQSVFKIGEYKFDSTIRKLDHPKEIKTLSMKEAELLHILCANMNNVVARDEFLQKVWGKTDEFTIDSMDVYLTRLRKHLKNDASIKIENIRGTGFILSAG